MICVAEGRRFRAAPASPLARHKGFAWLLVCWLGVMALCSLWLHVAECGINKAIGNPFDALWWGVVTLTTVGYGDVHPVTAEGRLAAVCLMLLGIGLFGAITATITSYILSSELRRVEATTEADLALDRAAAGSLVAAQPPSPAAGPSASSSTPSGERTSSACGTLVTSSNGWRSFGERVT
jgi:hypothetical protein